MLSSLPSQLARRAWTAASLSADAHPVVKIEGSGLSNVDGSYAFNREDADAETPSFRCGSNGRHLYVDSEGRWRVGILAHRKSARAGVCGYLRSCPVVPGTLPAHAESWEVHDGPEWRGCRGLRVVGGGEVSLMLLTLHIFESEKKGFVQMSFTTIGGQEVARFELSAGNMRLGELRSTVSSQVCYPRVKLVLPDGRVLSESEDDHLLSSVLCGWLPEECDDDDDGDAGGILSVVPIHCVIGSDTIAGAAAQAVAKLDAERPDRADCALPDPSLGSIEVH